MKNAKKSFNNHLRVYKQTNFVLFSTCRRTFSHIAFSQEMHFLKSPECRKKSAIWVPIVRPLLIKNPGVMDEVRNWNLVWQ